MNPFPSLLSLAPADLDRIRAAAVAAYPAECCGLLAGEVTAEGELRVTRVVPAHNLLAMTRRDRFEIDPVARLALMRHLRGGAERLIGHYHSHPDRPAYPSSTDLAMAFEPDLIWVIVAVNNGWAGMTRAYRLAGTVIHGVPLLTRDTP
ncbi:MAG: Mov34/MPN/PAD-1 [Rhodospirillaceae bacterium]|nr:MAG: Mov34/MPN/PAD-1 [Rhodospirillaceae bacterium]